VTTTAGGIGLALTLAGTVSMSGAAAVLWLTSPDKRGAALKQGGLPLVATVVLAVAGAM
jgi:putative membrane protein